MLTKVSVKKPYTVIVGILVVIMLGVISFTKMTTDLLPSMNFPYVIVYTSYVGATPEQIEGEVVRPMESQFATLTDIKSINATASDNFGMVVLEFNDTADMNTAMIEINSKLTALTASWSDAISAPVTMKINPDMLPVSIVSVSKADMDIIELSDYVQNELIEEYESIKGVASVSASGAVTQELDITIRQSLIDVLNSAVLRDLDATLADAEQELIDAQAQIDDGKNTLAREKAKVLGQIADGEEGLNSFETQKPQILAGLSAQRDELIAQLDQVNAGIAQLEPLVQMTDEEREQLNALQQKLSELETQKTDLEARIASMPGGSQEQIDEAKKERDELKQQRADCEALIASLSGADADAARTELAALDNQINQAQTTLNAAKSAQTDAQNAYDATSRRITVLEQQLAQTAGDEEQPGTLGGENPPQTGEAPETGSDEEKVSEENKQSEENQAPEENKPTEQNPESQTEEIPTSENVPAPEQSVLAHAFVAMAEGQTREQMESELSACRAALEEEGEALDKAKADVASAQKTCDTLNAERQKKQDAVNAMENGTAQTQIDAAQAEINRLNGRIEALDKEIADMESGSSDPEQKAKLQSALDAVNAGIAEIRNSKAYAALTALQSGSDINEQYAQAVAAKNQLEAGLQALNANIEKLENNIIPGGMMDGVTEDTSVEDAKAQLSQARSMAASGFGEAEEKLKEAADQIAEARKEFEDKRQEAYEEAGLDGIITVNLVAQILGAQNFAMPAGYVYDAADEKTMVRVGEEYASLQELRNTKLFDMGLDTIDEVHLYDVATVSIVDDSADQFTKVDGRDGILLSIEKQSTFSTTEVAERVAAKTAQLMAEDPALNVVDMFNQGEYINIVVDSVLENLIYGGLLAVLVLLVFLLDWRPTLIIAFSIPLSVVIAFVCMYFMGITLNVLSLSGLALGIGMLVDNSIVSIENIYRMRDEEGMPIIRASIVGVKQVGGALISSTLTTISVFLPIVFVTGMARDLFADLGITITVSLLASLLVAMTVVPSMSVTLLRKPKKNNSERGLFNKIRKFYVWLLRGALKVKPLVLGLALGLLVYTVLQVPDMSITFMPQVNSAQMSATLKIDDEAELEPQQDAAMALMTDIMTVQGVKNVGLNGASGTMSLMSSGSDLTYYIIVDTECGRTNGEIGADISAFAQARGMDVSVATSTMDISMLTGSGVSIDISGDDLAALQESARRVADEIAKVEGTADISDGLEKTVPELKITVDKEKAIDKHLTVAQVYQFVAQKLVEKVKITSAEIDDKEMDLYLIDARNREITPETLLEQEIEVTSGDKSEMVRIGDVANVEEVQSLTSISRSAQRRQISVTFQAAEGYSLSHLSGTVTEQLKALELPEGCEIEFSGENETVMEIMKNMVFVLLIAIALIFLIMVAQFQSFKSPFIVLFTIPLAFTGGLASLQIVGMDLSIVAVVGFLVLEGIVVNNGIVFVDSVNQMRIEGMSKKEALLKTGSLRLRPILMTALTTILGMGLMALGTGMGAEMMQPMAVVVVGGLLYSTLMTLFIVPVMYDMFNGKKMKAREIEMRAEEDFE